MRFCCTLITLLALTAVTSTTWADRPIIGFEETLVDLPAGYGGGKGYRVDRVNRGTRAARLGLERGDIIVFIDKMGFQNEEAFNWIMGQVGETAQIGIINVRDGKLKWLKCHFGHTPHRGEAAPDGVAFVNFGGFGVVTIYNHTNTRLNYQLRHRENGKWSEWKEHIHKHPNRGWHSHTFPQAEKVEIRFDRIGGDDKFTEQIYDLKFNERAGNVNIGKDDGRPYYFEFDAGGRLLELKRRDW